MKKNIFIAIAFVVLFLQQLAAQDSAQVSASVSRGFETSFQGAQHVRWNSLPRKITGVQFHYRGGSWVAYFDPYGKLITSGRRIKSVNDVPLKVQAGFVRAKTRMEKKTGTMEIAIIYEML